MFCLQLKKHMQAFSAISKILREFFAINKSKGMLEITIQALIEALPEISFKLFCLRSDLLELENIKQRSSNF